MQLKNEIQPDDFCFSRIYGSGIYQTADKQCVQDPVSGGDGQSPLLKNIITGETFFARLIQPNFERDLTMADRLRCQILTPPSRNVVLWPSDLVMLNADAAQQCTLFANQLYSFDPTPVREEGPALACLFPYGGYPRLEDMRSRLAAIPDPSWKEPRVRDMVRQLLLAIRRLNQNGYIYSEIHLSRFLFRENGSVLLDYSPLIQSYEDVHSRQADTLCAVAPDRYPMEFGDSSVFSGKQKFPDFQSQNFSLCALLFYLFFQRYPYDGRLMSGQRDDSVQSHYTKFRDYQKMPVFIFDPADNSNRLGIFDLDRKNIELWESCPQSLRSLFTDTLRQGNAERSITYTNPTPDTWLDLFDSLGWFQDKAGN